MDASIQSTDAALHTIRPKTWMPISLCTMSRTMRVKNSQGERRKILPFGTLHKCSTPSQPTQPRNLCYFPLVALQDTEEKERALFSHSLHCSERGFQMSCSADSKHSDVTWLSCYLDWLTLAGFQCNRECLPSLIGRMTLETKRAELAGWRQNSNQKLGK